MNTIKIKNHKVKYRVNGKEVHLFVYGTTPLRGPISDWGADLMDTLNCAQNPAGFHTGAYNAALMILEHPGLLCDLNNKDVIIGGVSMGGAVAECLSAIIKGRSLARVPVAPFSFGGYPSTPFGEAGRFIRGRDIVPRLFNKRFSTKGVIFKRSGRPAGRWPTRFISDHMHYDFSVFWNFHV